MLRRLVTRRRFLSANASALGVTTIGFIIGLSGPAAAQQSSSGALGAEEIVILAALIGTVSFAVLSAIALIRARNRAEADNADLRQQAANLRAAADRAESIINADDQRIVVWDSVGGDPTVIGDIPELPSAPENEAGFLAFGRWLSAQSAAELDRCIDRLRAGGEAFRLLLSTDAGRDLEATGQTAGSRAVVRFRDPSRDRLALAHLNASNRRLEAEHEALKAALDASSLPSWIRDAEGRLCWVNEAYRNAVGAGDKDSAISAGSELLDQAGRDAIAEARSNDRPFRQRLSVVVGGRRLVLDVSDAGPGEGSAGVAVDATDLEASEAALKRQVEFHAQTLDQLATAVAVFGADRRLRSYNAAYRGLFDLEPTVLDSAPSESEILDRLRATAKLPEQADYRAWKDELLSVYQAVDARVHLWHLPEGTTLRVVGNPHPEGGVTWIYEDVTERLDLESRYNSLIRIQGETLDHLREGVAVFGSDGRLRLHNPAFVMIWDLDEEKMEPNEHISAIAKACQQTMERTDEWDKLTGTVAGVDETRGSVSGRMELKNGRIVDYATVPLPEGQVMVTFVDISDTVRVERALLDRNDALEAADRLKNEFIQHVSYELRSPLTNMIGFTQLLADANVGPLNAKQDEYVGYIMTSGQSLLTIVNDILDLATIDAGIMELELSDVDLGEAIDSAVEGVRDRLAEREITVEKRIPASIGSLVADEKRLRQILYNLLSNAIGFSRDGGRVSISARRQKDKIVLLVEDEGVGIPKDFVGLVFDRFISRPSGSARGGVGLGLAIVRSFVELHGGEVSITSRRDKGTTVRVSLPLRPEASAIAAE